MSLVDAASWADGLVLAIPIDAIESVIAELAPHLPRETVLTDTASVKAPMVQATRTYLQIPGNWVGAHPMAGGDMSGFPYSRADLFRGAPCILTPEGHEFVATVDRVDQFWQGLGTFTVRKTPEEHDAITAVLSHVPHVIAFAFGLSLPDAETLRLAGPGLRDFMRIARGNPQLWCEILLRNRRHIAEDIAQFEKDLGGILEALGRGDRAALEEALRRAQASVENLER
jgi:prephenate dehydrogenase